ncbi:Stage II sporulation protein M [Thermanaeromonas toyohensis ToBE]|uniref:Stage II sporulation protein M n=1 Tax=Thermanaeromonas toyohensis ToBE TaxID=698762 RepID=A0A1W1VTM2_9FIRM|nr:stage II sporulation protein M [Thermanaeromonas toyohensis]SMB96676.1 Stage II sporulation protein M [Thermanaeromonas toyohensis ToBE]
MRRSVLWVALAAAVFALGGVAGAFYLSKEPWQLVPVTQAMERHMRLIPESRILLFGFILSKNVLAVTLGLFAEQILVAVNRLRVQAAVRLRFPQVFTKDGSVPALFLGRLVPAGVLAVNGAVLAGMCYLLRSAGTKVTWLAAGLVPHGVPELLALFLACGAGITGTAPEEKFVLLRRAVLPLLTAAAFIEVWVTPEVMRLAG